MPYNRSFTGTSHPEALLKSKSDLINAWSALSKILQVNNYLKIHFVNVNHQ